jgi:hypothetical protein
MMMYNIFVKQVRVMTQKYLYLVDHFIPWPQSEYGGIWNVIAKNDDECFDLITAEDNQASLEYYSKLKENVIKAQKFKLVDDYESDIIEAFTT